MLYCIEVRSCVTCPKVYQGRFQTHISTIFYCHLVHSGPIPYIIYPKNILFLIHSIPLNHILVGGFNPSEKILVRWEGLSYILWTIKKCLKPPTRSHETTINVSQSQRCTVDWFITMIPASKTWGSSEAAGAA